MIHDRRAHPRDGQGMGPVGVAIRRLAGSGLIAGKIAGKIARITARHFARKQENLQENLQE